MKLTLIRLARWARPLAGEDVAKQQVRGKIGNAGRGMGVAEVTVASVLKELIECPVAMLSSSPERDDMILMRDPFQD